MYAYGKNITGLGMLDFMLRPKTWAMNRLQHKFLNHFSKNLHHKRYSSLFSKISRSFVGAYPYSIKLEVNDYCTLNCKMCYVQNKKQELPLSQIKNLLNQIKGYKIRLEILGGEPLLREDITQIISYAKKEAKVPFITLYTNGINITEQLAGELKKAGLDGIIVSLISHQAEVHDSFTGTPGAWKKTIDGIGHCLKAGIETYTFTAIHQDNYKDYMSIYSFVKDQLKAHALFYQYIPQIKNDPLVIDKKTWNEIKRQIMYELNPVHAKFVRDFYLLTGNACSGGNFVFTVKVDGSVQPCPFVDNIPLGNIKKDSFWKIIRNRYKGTQLKNFKSTPEECKSCTYQSVCGGGCKAGNDKLNGDYCSKDHRCMGPYAEPIKPEKVIDNVPSFF